jgi:L-ascorbate metabolism protein UlaG (beta-lactamase superfamily)
MRAEAPGCGKTTEEDSSMSTKWSALLFTFTLTIFMSSAARAQNVTITPLGAAAGEFCVGDRALLFEDPTGVRVLIAPGRTVNGSADPRLGATGSIHVVLIDHPHVDHIGDVFHTNCAGSSTSAFAFPDEGNAPEIAAVHNSAVLVGGELPDFFTQKIKNITGTAPGSCPAATLNNNLSVPRTSPCVGVIRGGTRTVVSGSNTQGVKITTIPAFHAGGAPRIFVDDDVVTNPGGKDLPQSTPGVAPGLTGYAGSETGYILRFTNGLSVLWTGDSGLIGDWATQSQMYGTNLAVVHMGDLFTMGPDEANFALRNLIKPKSVIPEHANQVSTTGGVVNATSRVARLITLLSGSGITVNVPLSGISMQFDGTGACVAGCQ